jgi:hypothetical protein
VAPDVEVLAKARINLVFEIPGCWLPTFGNSCHRLFFIIIYQEDVSLGRRIILSSLNVLAFSAMLIIFRKDKLQ